MEEQLETEYLAYELCALYLSLVVDHALLAHIEMYILHWVLLLLSLSSFLALIDHLIYLRSKEGVVGVTMSKSWTPIFSLVKLKLNFTLLCFTSIHKTCVTA